MPYTKEELKSGEVEFYNEYIDKLRRDYIRQLVDHAKPKLHNDPPPFRDNNGIFYSFEDIPTGLGIESAMTFREVPEYSTLATELTWPELITYEGEDDISDPEEGFEKWIREHSKSVQNKSINETIKDDKLNALIDRSFSELIQVEVMKKLPEELENGDTVTTDDPTDLRKWLIDGGQKRIFPDLQTFYTTVDWENVKTLDLEVIDSIPSGEPVD